MSDDFNFSERRSERLIKEVREAEENRIRQQKLGERALALAEAISKEFLPPLHVEPDGTSIKVQDGKGNILYIGVLDGDKYSLRVSDNMAQHEVPKNEMMDLVDL